MEGELIAVTGLACRFPGAASVVALCESALADGATALPTRGGALRVCEGFDLGFFGVSERQAAALDPQARLLLELAWEALADAGIAPSESAPRRLTDPRVGLFLACGPDDYLALAQAAGRGDALLLETGARRAALPGRIAHLLGADGPALGVDADRAASLVAVHLACRSLRAGECSVALVGGAQWNLTPRLDETFRRAGLLAEHGRARPFDDDADGTHRADGAALAVLELRSHARARGVRPRALIRGGAVRQVGAADAPWTPDVAAQTELLRAAYADAEVDPRTVSYVEAHATGTRAGDAAEAEALGAVLGAGRGTGEPCRIGSIKGLLGHTEAAAGITGLVQAVLALEARRIPPTPACRVPRRDLDWPALGLLVARRGAAVAQRDKTAGEGAMRVAVSAFGLTGSGAHVVLEEALEDGSTRPAIEAPRWQRHRAWLLDPPISTATASPASTEAPEIPLLDLLRARLGEALGVEGSEVPIDHSLLELGLDSLDASELAQHLRDARGLDVTPQQVLDAADLAELARRLEPSTRHAEQVPEQVPPERFGPCVSPGQEALLALQRLAPAATAYHLALAWRVSPHGRPLDAPALRRAAVELELRHPELRARFTVPGDVPGDDDTPRKHYAPSPAFGWREDRLDAPGDDTPDDGALLRRLERERDRPFDLAAGPLVRWTVLRSTRGDALLLTVHHIVADFHALEILVRDLGALYGGRIYGDTGDPPDPGIGRASADAHAHRQRKLEHSATGERLWSFWKRRLRGAPDLALPTDGPRPPVQTWNGDRVARTVSPDPLDALRRLGAAHSASLTATLMAAVFAALARWTGQSDLVLATPVDGRDPGEDELVGDFADPLPLRLDLGAARNRAEGGFGALLEGVAATLREALEHRELPFSVLARRLGADRDPSRPPLYQAMVALERTRRRELRGLAAALVGIDGEPLTIGPEGKDGDGDGDGALHLESLAPATRAAQIEFSVVAVETRAGLVLSAIFQTDLFDRTTAQRILDTVVLALHRAVDRPRATLDALTAPSKAARHQLLVEFNDAPGAARPFEELLRRCDANAVERPDAVALVADGPRPRLWTWATLRRRVLGLAAELRRRGIGPERVVALALPRGPELVLAQWAILEAGGAHLSLDLDHPPPRLAFQLGDAAASLLIAEPGFDERFPEIAEGIARLELAPTGHHRAPEAADPSSAAPLPDALAYLLYTSGSTGEPKGVGLTRRGFAHHTLWMQAELPLHPGDRLLQRASPSFDASVCEIWAALVGGGCLVFPSPGAHRDALELADLLRRWRITVLHGVPSLYRVLLDTPGFQGAASTLRRLVCGGEPLPTPLARRLEALGALERIHFYGPTETTIDAAWARLDALDDRPTASFGRPLAGLRIHLLDRQGVLVPLGAVGELVVGGPSLARAYRGRPATTAERFVPDPFAGVPAQAGARLYRSGDLARRRADGTLEIVGRADRQLKVRGVRLEPGEIEAVLESHPQVRRAAVGTTGMDDPPRLTAWVELRGAGGESPATPFDAEILRRYVSLRLPDPLVPSRWIALDHLPTTAAGKLDRGALAASPTPAAKPPAPPTPPRNAREAVLARIWEDVLGCERVGVHDSFFALGGDSILAMRIAARAAREGLRVVPGEIFRHVTLAESAAAALPLASASVDAEQGPVVGPAELAPAQLDFFRRNLPEPSHANQAVLLEPEAALDPAVLRRALAVVVAHHDALRARFRRRPNGLVVQDLADAVDPADDAAAHLLVHVDLRGIDEADDDKTDDDAFARLADDVQASLDLERGPLLRAALVELGGGQRLLLAVHHLVVDTVSWRPLLADLASALRGAPLPPKTTSWPAWTGRLAVHAQSPEAAAELDVWTRRAATADSLAELAAAARLPVDGRRRAGAGSAASIKVELDAERTARLLERAPSLGVGVEALLVVALLRALAPWTGRRRLWLELEGHGREQLWRDLDLTRTVGWFTSFHPVLVDLDAAPGRPADAARAIDQALRSAPRRGLGFGLLRELGPRDARDRLAALPEPEIAFNYLGRLDALLESDAPWRVARGPVGRLTSRLGLRRRLLEIDAGVRGGRLRARWSFSREAHAESTLRRLADSFLEALAALSDELNEIEDVYPLTPMQEGMLFDTLREPSSYVEQWTACLRGTVGGSPIRGGELDAALRALAERHPILRTVFAWSGLDRPEQRVRRRATVDLRVFDVRDLPPPAQRARLEALRRAEAERGLDLEQAPPWRVCALRTDADTYHLLLTHHHLLADGWSVQILLDELLERLARPEIALPKRPLRPYVEWIEARDRQGAEGFWRRRLAGLRAPTPLHLESAEARDAAPGSPRGERWRAFDPLQSERVRAFARRREITQATLVLGAWAWWLARVGGQRQVLFGFTRAVRPAEVEGVEEILGPLINTLPLNVQVGRGETGYGFLRRLQAAQGELEPWARSSLVEIRAASEIPPSAPLFESVVVFESYPPARRAADGVVLEDLLFHDRDASPLTLVVHPGERWLWRLAFDARRFTPTAVERALRQVTGLVLQWIENGDEALDRLDPMSRTERHQLLVEQGAAADPHPLGELLRRGARRAPDRIAIDDGDLRLSFADLEARVDGLARRLRGAGLGAEDLVAIDGERGAGCVLAVLAVLRTGAAWLPLPPELPSAGRREMLADARPQARLEIDRGGLGVRLLDLGDKAAMRRAPFVEHPLHAAYLLYTSGSTGRPKGALNTRGALANRLAWMARRFEFGGDDAVLHKTPSTFDVSIWEILLPAVVGCRLVIAAPGEHLDPGRLARRLIERRVTTLHFVPALLDAFLDDPATAEVARHAPTRHLVTSGEALARATARRALDHFGEPRLGHFGEPRLDNLYGPTEAAIDVSARRVDHRETAPQASSATVGLGLPIDGLRLVVADSALRPLPLETPGELWIGGVGPARGYAGDPARTAESFVPDPFAERPGARLYRSGDRVRRRADGDLIFLGRNDAQVKIRGVRVEPGEVEARLRVLAADPDTPFRDAAVRVDLPGDGPGDGPRLLAWLVPRSPGADRRALVDAARAALGELLPAAMVPTGWTVVEALPRGAHGKLDRRSLPLPTLLDPAADEPPRGEIEQRLAALWQDLLGLAEPPSRDADFTLLGGHSLLAIRLAGRLPALFGVELPVSRWIAAPRLSTLAALIAEITGAEITGAEIADAEITDAEPFSAPTLPEDIRPGRPHRRRAAAPRRILLTGATGFLGVHLADTLLRDTSAVIFCLVRPTVGQGGAADRLRRSLRDAGQGAAARAVGGRLRPLAGDLERPGLGLDAADWDALAEDLDLILHNGARVNLLYPYASLAAANVEAVAALLRLAARADAEMAYVSTLDVLTPHAAPAGSLPEPPPPPTAPPGGYARSKWAAEHLVLDAARRGLATRILRTGGLAPSASGHHNPHDWLEIFLNACLELRAAPRLGAWAMPWAPVDDVARVLVALLAEPPRSGGEIFHLTADRLLRPVEILDALRRRGRVLEELEPAAWRARLEAREGDAVGAFGAILEHGDPFAEPPPPVDDARSRAHLAELGVDGCGAADPDAVAASLARRPDPSGAPEASTADRHATRESLPC